MNWKTCNRDSGLREYGRRRTKKEMVSQLVAGRNIRRKRGRNMKPINDALHAGHITFERRIITWVLCIELVAHAISFVTPQVWGAIQGIQPPKAGSREIAVSPAAASSGAEHTLLHNAPPEPRTAKIRVV